MLSTTYSGIGQTCLTNSAQNLSQSHRFGSRDLVGRESEVEMGELFVSDDLDHDELVDAEELDLHPRARPMGVRVKGKG